MSTELALHLTKVQGDLIVAIKHLKEVCSVLGSAADGKPLEYFDGYNEQWFQGGHSGMCELVQSVIDDIKIIHGEYRIRPTAKLRPWKRHEVKPFAVVVRKAVVDLTNDAERTKWLLKASLIAHIFAPVLSDGMLLDLLNNYWLVDADGVLHPCGVAL